MNEISYQLKMVRMIKNGEQRNFWKSEKITRMNKMDEGIKKQDMVNNNEDGKKVREINGKEIVKYLKTMKWGN